MKNETSKKPHFTVEQKVLLKSFSDALWEAFQNGDDVAMESILTEFDRVRA